MFNVKNPKVELKRSIKFNLHVLLTFLVLQEYYQLWQISKLFQFINYHISVNVKTYLVFGIFDNSFA